MKAFYVFLNGELVDTVHFVASTSAADVKKSLIDHDGYNPDIFITAKKACNLKCACCGSVTKGRQWFNQDTGYGLCPKCYDWISGRGMSGEELQSTYGHRGIHHCLPEAA